MSSVGFKKYTMESWYFDWGKQVYISNRNSRSHNAPEKAWYGYVDLPDHAAR